MVLFAGELSRRSGFYLLVEAFERLVELHPHASLFIAGWAAKRAQLRKALQVLNGPKLAGRAYYLGALPEAALPEFLASSRIVAIPLLRDMDQKVLALQAMASGAATLSTSLGGLEDLPTLKCEPTVEGLLQGLETAWADAQIARRQHEQVVARYSHGQWENAWLTLMNEMQTN